MDELTKEQLVAMLGPLEDFSAEEIRKQLDIRQKAAANQLARFRKANGLTVRTK